MSQGKFNLPDDLILSKSSDHLKELASENSIPLSPQWLYTKSSENRMDVRSPTPGPLGNPSDPNLKDAWRLDAPEDKKERRKSVPDNDASRKWREEERETGLLGAARKGDRRKVERRVDNVSSRETGDTKNIPASDRWHDVNPRAAVHESRRDNKWSSRWGPEDKGKETSCEKVDNNKDKEEPQSESQSVFSSVRAAPERDTEPRDKWRPRHRMESQTGGPTSYRAAPGFGLEKGRADGPNLGFTMGRGRASAIGRGSSASLGAGAHAFLRNESIPGKQSPSASVFRYPRGKLLDMYRKQKPGSSLDVIPTEMEEVDPITQVTLIEPLAFTTPDAEEEASLNSIWKGRITNSEEYTSYGQESLGETTPVNCRMPDSAETIVDDALLGAVNGYYGSTHGSVPGLLGSHNGGSGGGLSVSGLNAVASKSYGSIEAGYEIPHGSPEAVRSAFDKSSVMDGNDSLVASFEQDYMGKLQQPDIEVNHSEVALPPEEIMFSYIDPQGVVQGPFIGSNIISWFEQGFFGTDLQVRLANAPEGTPFQDLGRVLPFLNIEGVPAHLSNQKSELEETKFNANSETALSVAPVAESNDSSSITGTSLSYSVYDNPSAQDNLQRNSESVVYAKPPDAKEQRFLDFSTQDEEIVFPGRAEVTSYEPVISSTSMHDGSMEYPGHSAMPVESIKAATRNLNENKLHPFGVLWSELESSNTPDNLLPNRSYDAIREPTGSIDNWSIDSRRNTQRDPNMSLDALAANRMSQFEHVNNRFNLGDQLPLNQQQLQNRDMLLHSHIGDQAQDLEHLLTLQLQQQQKIQLQQQQKIQLQQQQKIQMQQQHKIQLQQQQLEQEHQLYQKLLLEQQQSHARQLHSQQILQGQIPDSRFGHSHGFSRSNSVDQMLLEQHLMNELQKLSGHPSRNSTPYIDQLAAGSFGQLPPEGLQRELHEQLFPTQLQSQYGQMQSEQIRSLEYQLQQEQLMQLANGVRHNTLLEEQRHIDPLWPSDHNNQLLRTHPGIHRPPSSAGFRPLDFQQQQQRPSFEDQFGQLERNLTYEQQLRQEFMQGLPFERSASLPVNALGLNVDAVNDLGLSQGLELRDAAANMQLSGRLGNSTPGFNHENPRIPLGEQHLSQLEPLDGRWSGADAQLAGDWAESQFHRSNIDAEHHKMRSENRRLGEDSNSWMLGGSTEDRSKQLFMEFLHQRPGHQSAESPNMNHGELYDRMAPSSLNPSSAIGSQAFSDEHRLLGDRNNMGSLHRNNSLLSGINDGGRSSQNENQAFGNMFSMNKDMNDNKTWNSMPPKVEGMERMSFEGQDRVLDSLGHGEVPVGAHSRQSSFNISEPYRDNLGGENRRKDRLLVPSHGQDAVLLKRPPSSHEGLLEHMSGTANRTATAYSGTEGMRREAGAALGNKGSVSEASFSEMLKKNSSVKKTVETSDATEGRQGGGGKKKGKKGKQIDPALLGFKVTSNRILMGEIHRADDF